MNKKISHGSPEETLAFSMRMPENQREIGLIGRIGLRAASELLEQYDPGAAGP